MTSLSFSFAALAAKLSIATGPACRSNLASAARRTNPKAAGNGPAASGRNLELPHHNGQSSHKQFINVELIIGIVYQIYLICQSRKLGFTDSFLQGFEFPQRFETELRPNHPDKQPRA
jgi:hypothetical protein